MFSQPSYVFWFWHISSHISDKSWLVMYEARYCNSELMLRWYIWNSLRTHCIQSTFASLLVYNGFMKKSCSPKWLTWCKKLITQWRSLFPATEVVWEIKASPLRILSLRTYQDDGLGETITLGVFRTLPYLSHTQPHRFPTLSPSVPTLLIRHGDNVGTPRWPLWG